MQLRTFMLTKYLLNFRWSSSCRKSDMRVYMNDRVRVISVYHYVNNFKDNIKENTITIL